ncbi:MAG TPA: zinc-ribbon domain-containing protein, partial [Polyangiaceae bacterium]|nr:zinc-ribbon domain-containing protein [Polyangiaceae bacterium]
MNVACSSCPAKYAVPDEKVRGRKVRITCKRCGAPIIVDGTGLAAGDAAPSPAASEGGDASSARAAAAPTETAKAAPEPPVASTASAGAAPGPTPESKPGGGEPAALAAAPANAPASPEATAEPAKPAAATAKPLTGVAKGGEPKALAFPKPGAIAAKGAVLGSPLGGAGSKAATPVAAAATAAKGGAATPGKAATAALGVAAASKATPIAGAAGTSPVAGVAARGAAASAQAARAVVPRTAGAAAPAVAPSALPERTWTVAVTDDDHHEMTLTQIVEAYAAQKIDAETFIWRDGMQDWLMPFEIGEIATALRARRLVPRTNAAAGVDGAPPFSEEPPPGAWREPGRWDRAASLTEEPSFDDVTVAMAGPKAKALLQAVSTEEASKATDAGRAAPGPSTPKADDPTMIAPKADEPTTVQAPLPVTPASLGFGFDEEAPKPAAAPTESISAIAESLEREPERLPFELGPSATAPRAALKSGTNEADADQPRDLFARGATDDAASGTESESDGEGETAAKALTGARNESSVLFSLDQLSKPAAKPAAPSAPKKTDEAALLLGEGADAAPVAGLGGGGLFGATKMAAPDFTAPPAPSVPPPAKKSTSTAPGASEKPSRGAGLWIGIAAVLVAAGGAAYFLTHSPEPAPTASPTATATTAAAPTVPAAEPTATATAAPETTASAS